MYLPLLITLLLSIGAILWQAKKQRKANQTPMRKIMTNFEKRFPFIKNSYEPKKNKHQPLLDDLRQKAQIDIVSLAVLVNTSERYPEAIPILVDHLDRPYNECIKEAIVRSLAVSEAKGVACQALLNEFYRIPNYDLSEYRNPAWIRCDLKWIIGNTMAVVATKPYEKEIIKIVADEAHAGARSRFIEALRKLKATKAKPILIRLLKSEHRLEQREAARALKVKAFREAPPHDGPTLGQLEAIHHPPKKKRTKKTKP